MDDRALLHYTEQLDPPETDFVGTCPICGTPLNEDEEVYLSADNEVIGCEFCVTTRPAGEVWN